MSLDPDKVAAASEAMTWVPGNATTEETDEYRLVRLPGATVTDTVDVLALDLSEGAPALLPPDLDVTVSWATDLQTITDSTRLAAEIFGGSVPPHARLVEMAERDSAAIPGGRGGMVVAYADETPLGTGGVGLAAGVVRLWGGAVRPAARGRGVYRATLDARLQYGAAHGATMALVNVRVETSGPILRQAGFAGYGQEFRYRVPLQ